VVTGGEVLVGDGLGLAVDMQRLRGGQRLDVLGVLEEAWVPDHPCRGADQEITVVEGSADIVGIAAGGHRQVFLLLDQGDLSVLVHAACLGGRLGTGGGAADDDDFSCFRHASMLLF
jgi:hypothetical protein